MRRILSEASLTGQHISNMWTGESLLIYLCSNSTNLASGTTTRGSNRSMVKFKMGRYSGTFFDWALTMDGPTDEAKASFRRVVEGEILRLSKTQHRVLGGELLAISVLESIG